MNTAAIRILCACALISCLATSVPIYPGFGMKHYLPTDICLFICNICFDGMSPEMLDCANNVCLTDKQPNFILGLLKIGRTCNKYTELASLKNTSSE